jgi:hypothetical protein
MPSTIQQVTITPGITQPFYAIGPDIITSAGYTTIDFGVYSIQVLSNILISINNGIITAQGLNQTQFSDFVTGLISALGGTTSIDVGDISVTLKGGSPLYGTTALAPTAADYIISYISVSDETLSTLLVSGEGEARIDLYLNAAIVYTTQLTRYTPDIDRTLDIAILSGTEVDVQITCNAIATSNYYATLIHG